MCGGAIANKEKVRMSRRKLFGIRVLVLCLILAGLAVAVPAFSHDEECPPGWTTEIVAPGTGADKNENTRICRNELPGNGQGNGTIPGTVEKDDHFHQNVPLPL
jgi:homoserine acetyltransferase